MTTPELKFSDEEVREAFKIAFSLLTGYPNEDVQAIKSRHLEALQWAAGQYLKAKDEIEKLENEIYRLKDAYQRANDLSSF